MDRAGPGTPLSRAAHLAANDDPLTALAVLEACGPEGESLRQALRTRTAHLQSRDAYAAFYRECRTERPYTPLHVVPRAHDVHIRWALVRDQLLTRRVTRVLELGCADGWTLLNLGFAGVEGVGVDLATHMVAEGRRRAALWSLPTTFHEGFAEDANLPGGFDAVLLLEILEHVPDVAAVCRAAERHLRPGGIVIVSFPLDAPEHAGEREAREHVRRFDREATVALLSAPGRALEWYMPFAVGGPAHGKRHHVGAYSLR